MIAFSKLKELTFEKYKCYRNTVAIFICDNKISKYYAYKNSYTGHFSIGSSMIGVEISPRLAIKLRCLLGYKK